MKKKEYHLNAVFELISRVESELQDNAVIKKLVKDILEKEKLDKDEVLRRDYDGNSSAEYLVEKMIGEYLAEGEIRF